MGKNKHSYHFKSSTTKIFISLLSFASTIFLHQLNTQAFSLKITTPTPLDLRLYPGVGIAGRKGDTFFLEKENTVGEIVYEVDYKIGAKIKFEESDPIGNYEINFIRQPKHGSKRLIGRRTRLGFSRSSSAIVESPEFFFNTHFSLRGISDFFEVGSFTSSINLSLRVNKGADVVSKSFLEETNFHVQREKVPEPATILGLATILGCGALVKQESSKKKKS